MAIRIQVRRGTASQWTTADPVLAAGEIGFETNTGKFKIRLAPGKYSIVLGYQEGVYIPYFSGNTGVAFVEVLKHQYQEIDLSIIASSIY